VPVIRDHGGGTTPVPRTRRRPPSASRVRAGTREPQRRSLAESLVRVGGLTPGGRSLTERLGGPSGRRVVSPRQIEELRRQGIAGPRLTNTEPHWLAALEQSADVLTGIPSAVRDPSLGNIALALGSLIPGGRLPFVGAKGAKWMLHRPVARTIDPEEGFQFAEDIPEFIDWRGKPGSVSSDPEDFFYNVEREAGFSEGFDPGNIVGSVNFHVGGRPGYEEIRVPDLFVRPEFRARKYGGTTPDASIFQMLAQQPVEEATRLGYPIAADVNNQRLFTLLQRMAARNPGMWYPR
jgi:GNAT superfamily N-acetyltransferase